MRWQWNRTGNHSRRSSAHSGAPVLCSWVVRMGSTTTNTASAGAICSLMTLGGPTKPLRRNEFREIPFDEALARVEGPLKELGETLETAYDDAYISRKETALRAAGIEVLRLRIVPEDTVV